MLLSQIRAEEVQLEPGDRMVFGTDGITGASNREDESLGLSVRSRAAGRGDDRPNPGGGRDVQVRKRPWDITFVVVVVD